MGVSFGDSDAEERTRAFETPDAGEGSTHDVGTVSMVIDADWRAADLAEMLTALDETYQVFLAVELDLRSGRGSLGSTAADLGTLFPEGRLAIPTMSFASLGSFSFEGLGEVVHEVREFLMNLETIGQRRKRNRLELEAKEAELADLRAQREADQEDKAMERARWLQQDQLELMQLRQDVMERDLELSARHLQLTVQKFEVAYGPEWRNVEGARQQFERLLGAGNQLLSEFREGRIALPPGPEERRPTGDPGF
jgi:hypothetical protein